MSARALAKLFGTFHNVSYYAPEMKAFADLGLPEYWRAYMAYRSAPMGQVPPSVVQATFYNFAPQFVEAAIPSAWETTSPARAIALRDRCIAQALQRGIGDVDQEVLEEVTSLALPPIMDCDAGARPLFAAHRELPLPDEPLMRLWHTCTLWREYRGDGHNLALALARLDGVACHVLLAAKGVGNRDIIGKIRGWTSAEWDGAHHHLVERGLLQADGGFTDAGKELRDDVERRTDLSCQPARDLLGEEREERVLALLGPVVDKMLETGLVPGRWPPATA